MTERKPSSSSPKQTGPGDKPRPYKHQTGTGEGPGLPPACQVAYPTRRWAPGPRGARTQRGGVGARNAPPGSGPTRDPAPSPLGTLPTVAPAHVRVLGAGHDVRLELRVVEGRGGADQPPVLLAAGVELEFGQTAGQLVAGEDAFHLRAGGRARGSGGPRGHRAQRAPPPPAPRTLWAPGSSRRLGCSRRKAHTSAASSSMVWPLAELKGGAARAAWARAGLGGAPEADASKPGSAGGRWRRSCGGWGCGRRGRGW